MSLVCLELDEQFKFTVSRWVQLRIIRVTLLNGHNNLTSFGTTSIIETEIILFCNTFIYFHDRTE